jgi:hypothetical protein
LQQRQRQDEPEQRERRRPARLPAPSHQPGQAEEQQRDTDDLDQLVGELADRRAASEQARDSEHEAGIIEKSAVMQSMTAPLNARREN